MRIRTELKPPGERYNYGIETPGERYNGGDPPVGGKPRAPVRRARARTPGPPKFLNEITVRSRMYVPTDSAPPQTRCCIPGMTTERCRRAKGADKVKQ